MARDAMGCEGLTALRIAATLAHALPTVRVRIRDGERTLLEIGHPATVCGPALGPCAFRRAVAGAHEQVKQGQRLAFMGLPADVAPAVDIGVQAGDRALPGGIYRVTVGDQTVHGFATTLPPRRCREVLAALPDAAYAVRLHHDVATEVTFVHTVEPVATAPADGHHLEPLVEALIGEEVQHELAVAEIA
jgi:hypothetical protein